jgi:hypothetical protein
LDVKAHLVIDGALDRPACRYEVEKAAEWRHARALGRERLMRTARGQAVCRILKTASAYVVNSEALAVS